MEAFQQSSNYRFRWWNKNTWKTQTSNKKIILMTPNILLQQLENALPEGMQIPEELRQLYQWIEDNGYYDRIRSSNPS